MPPDLNSFNGCQKKGWMSGDHEVKPTRLLEPRTKAVEEAIPKLADLDGRGQLPVRKCLSKYSPEYRAGKPERIMEDDLPAARAHLMSEDLIKKDGKLFEVIKPDEQVNNLSGEVLEKATAMLHQDLREANEKTVTLSPKIVTVELLADILEDLKLLREQKSPQETIPTALTQNSTSSEAQRILSTMMTEAQQTSTPQDPQRAPNTRAIGMLMRDPVKESVERQPEKTISLDERLSFTDANVAARLALMTVEPKPPLTSYSSPTAKLVLPTEFKWKTNTFGGGELQPAYDREHASRLFGPNWSHEQEKIAEEERKSKMLKETISAGGILGRNLMRNSEEQKRAMSVSSTADSNVLRQNQDYRTRIEDSSTMARIRSKSILGM